MITLTERAAQEVRQIIGDKRLPEDSLLRLGVAGGGCSGFEYVLDFCETPADGDEILESQGIRIAIDRKSLLYLTGLEISFLDWMMVGVPVTAVFLPFGWFALTRWLYPPGHLEGDASEVLLA